MKLIILLWWNPQVKDWQVETSAIEGDEKQMTVLEDRELEFIIYGGHRVKRIEVER